MASTDTASLLARAPDSSVLDMIGRTPLVRLHQFERANPGVELYAKAEWQNPGGSVKDRAAARMILEGEVSGQLTPDKIIIDATSGNTGIAYAMIGARRGYRVKLLMPANASVERKKLLKAYGAELVLTDPAQGSDGAFFETQKLYKEQPDLYFYPDQYGNSENPRAHYETTAAEIIEQTKGEVAHFIAGLGTSGTLIGTGRRLREFNPKIRIIAMQPSGPFHGLEGMKHMETASHVPEIYDAQFADEAIGVDTEDAQAMARRLTREEGLYVGVSSGAAVCAALKVDGKCVVAIAPDGGARYQSDKFWETK